MLKENSQGWCEVKEKKASFVRPFYELPVNIKPCSRIIQETRRQLSRKGKSSGKAAVGITSDQDDQEDGLTSNPASPYSQFLIEEDSVEGPVMESFYESYFDELLTSPSTSYDNGRENGFPSIRPVHTQRPKTGIDHGIWGISSRKRPPSAITLSRLSLEDFEEESSSTSVHANTTCKGTAESGREAFRTDREKQTLLSPEASAFPPGLGENNRIGAGSCVNVTSKERECYEMPVKECEETTERLKDLSLSQSSSTSQESFRSNEELDWGEGLIPAVNKLHAIVKRGMEGRPLKSEVIASLQRVKSHMEKVQDCPAEVKLRLLKLIFKLVETNQQDEDVVFWASFVLLQCRIRGTNLTTVFKMVFKASRSKEYWAIILDTEYLDLFMESFGQVCPLTQTESMIYGYGTLKFICMEVSVLTRIFELNLIPIMSYHLKLLNYELLRKVKTANGCSKRVQVRTRHPHIPETLLNGVFQLTSILRNVVGEESSLEAVVSSGLLEELCNSLEWTMEDIDILSNIVRILSVVSGNSLCCQCISSNATFARMLVTILQMWHSKDDVIVRLTYCLGNLLASCEDFRVMLFQGKTCYTMILHLIKYHLEKPSPISEDILIKTIRILANWSLSGDVGREICEDPQTSYILNSILTNKEVSEELLTCVISTLNNTSFYKSYTSADIATVETAQHLYEYLTWKNTEGRTEVVKVLGNLTRNPIIRKMTAEHVDKILVSLEEEESEELLCATVGVLMNVIVESRARKEFITHRGVDHLLHLMRVNNDLALNLMICQFMWNIQVSTESLRGEKNTRLIDASHGLEIQELIQKKLEAFEKNSSLLSREKEQPYSDVQAQFQEEYQSVAKQLLNKLIVSETE